MDATPAYRGFLFSDVRGFTAFAERYGNSAAAAMVGRFLEIARNAIARHDGAEIKTEGDAIHAVFPSASGAVLCGLEIVEAAAEASARQPDRPLGLGVGIHAGEAVETAEGYIGRAVNIAARLCAQARPGEVLVSSTVKGITQASIPVGFIPRGRKRLKGIEDPILVYAVTRDTDARAPRELPRAIVLGWVGFVAIVVIGIAAIAGSWLLPSGGAKPGATSGVSAGPTTQPLVIGALPIGTYASTAFQPPITIDVVVQGWAASRDLPDYLGLVREVSPRGGLDVLRVGEVIGNPCTEGGETPPATPSAADVLAQLQALTHLTLSDRKPVQVGGLAGEQVEVTVSDGAQAACGGPAGSGVSIFVAGDQVWSAAPGERFRLAAVDAGSGAVTFIVSTDWSVTPSVEELENMLERGQEIVDSVRFRGDSPGS
jgi:class 3 adenylate cyclase